MSEYYNCNFKVNDIIIGINPDNKYTYLKIFRIKDFKVYEEYGRKIVDYATLEHVDRNDVYVDIHTDEVVVRFLNNNFKRLMLEEV